MKASYCSSRILKAITAPSIRTYRKCFITYVRPILEYASIIWSPHQQFLIDRLEKVQKRFTKIALLKIDFQKHSSLNYAQRLHLFNLQSLHHRRLVIDIVECFKILKCKQSDPIFQNFYSFEQRSVSRRGPFRLTRSKFLSNTRSRSFKLRTEKLWNALPLTLRQTNSFSAFSNGIKDLDLITLL